LNRTIAPVLWASALNTNDGSIKNITAVEFGLSYTQIPEGVVNIQLDQCADANTTEGNKVADITTASLPIAEEIFCIDGNPIGAPRFGFDANMSKELQHNLNKRINYMKKAFSMIELIFVIVIIGILSAVAIRLDCTDTTADCALIE